MKLKNATSCIIVITRSKIIVLNNIESKMSCWRNLTLLAAWEVLGAANDENFVSVKELLRATYRKVSNIRRNKSQNLNASRLIL